MSADVGRPGELANGEPESVGGRQNDLLAGDLDANAGQHRQRVVTAGGDGDLADGLRRTNPTDTTPVSSGSVGSVG